MSLRLDKQWIDLDGLHAEEMPAQLGVFEVGDENGDVIYIGYAGGNKIFGLRTAITEELERLGSTARMIRWELTQGYLSRWEELMMVHRFDNGSPPPKSHPHAIPRGRLTPGGP
ncbi:MAG: DUF7508 domain-containing protein [Acidimicrobiales bacterium]